MGLLNALKSLIYKVDLLDSTSLLRVKGEPEHKTLVGGVISLSLILLLAAAFWNKIVDTFDKQIITSSAATNNANDPLPFSIQTLPSGPFMLGVQISNHNLNGNVRYFDIELSQEEFIFGESQNTTYYKFQPCSKSHWVGLSKLEKDYDKIGINNWMCLPKNQAFQVKGKYSSQASKVLNIIAKKCNNSANDSRPCADQADIDKLFNDNGGNLFFSIYFLNPIINADSQQYLDYYLEDSNYILFSQSGGEEARLFVEDFKIVTDQSILPNEDMMTESGGLISSDALKGTYTTIKDIYASFYFYKSSRSSIFNRSFQKLDDVFSYVGGLFGTVLIIFFLVSQYNTHKFQINISGYLYSTDQKEQKLQKKYNFLYFLGQIFYSLLAAFKINPDWKKLKYYHETREQALKQLDVLLLFKRVNFLEKSLSLLFSERQIKGLHLSSNTTRNQAVSVRRNYKLKPRLKQKIEEALKKKGEKFYFREKQQFDKFDGNISCDVFKDQRQINSQKQKDPQNIDDFLSDQYSSQSSSSQEQQLNLLAPVLELKKESQRNSISKKIWENIDHRLKELIRPIQTIYQYEEQKTAKEEIQQHKIANDEEQNPNLLMFQDQNFQDINQQNRKKYKQELVRQNFAKLRPIHQILQIHEE